MEIKQHARHGVVETRREVKLQVLEIETLARVVGWRVSNFAEAALEVIV